ncbi:hypothetical protein HOY82DRAFT_642225 [Tuber indicum]|nr:hypothetical protein HOY82DRAFT_642225 [Tuber indicum]
MVLFSNSARESGLALPKVQLFRVTDKLFTNHRSRKPRLQGSFGRESLGGGIPGVGEAPPAIRKAITAALFAPGRSYRHFNGKYFEAFNRRFFVGDGSDIEGTPMNLVSHLVSEKACGGSEFLGARHIPTHNCRLQRNAQQS